MNSIEIPASEFKKMFLQEGGQIQTAQKKEQYKDLTGQYLHALPSQVEGQANAEIEGGEHVATQGKVVKAEGKKHSEGGMDVKLETGDKVLSDHLKVDKGLAKKLSEQYDIKVTPFDTYAKVLDKYLKKIGHTEAVEEVGEYIKKLDLQKETVKDKSTLALNSEYLMDEINEENTKVQELEPQKNDMFELLYNQQEASKETEENTNKMQNGGMIQDLMQKYNITPERVKEMFQDGGRIEGFGYKPSFTYQKTNDPNFQGSYGELNKKTPSEVLQDNVRRFPELAKQFNLDKGKPSGENIAKFQLAINKHYDTILEDAKTYYKDNPEALSKFEQEVNKERFTIPTGTPTEGVVTDVDAKWGDFTSTRPNFEFNVLPPEVLNEVKKAGVNTASQLRENFPEYYKQYVGDKSLKSDFWLGDVPTETQPTAPSPPSSNPLPAPNTPEAQAEEEKRRMGLLLMPERMYQNPSFLAPMKFSPTIYTGERVEISPEQQLMEINRQQQATKEQLAQMPDAQRAATLASMDANLATASSKAVSDAERYNAQARERESYENAEVKTKQSLADNQSAAQYQQLMGRELAGFDANMQAQNNMRFQDQVANYKFVEGRNELNSRNPDVQYLGTGRGYEVRNPAEYIQNMLKSQGYSDEEISTMTKPKAKTGGRFNKKRFGK